MHALGGHPCSRRPSSQRRQRGQGGAGGHAAAARHAAVPARGLAAGRPGGAGGHCGARGRRRRRHGTQPCPPAGRLAARRRAAAVPRAGAGGLRLAVGAAHAHQERCRGQGRGGAGGRGLRAPERADAWRPHLCHCSLPCQLPCPALPPLPSILHRSWPASCTSGWWEWTPPSRRAGDARRCCLMHVLLTLCMPAHPAEERRTQPSPSLSALPLSNTGGGASGGGAAGPGLPRARRCPAAAAGGAAASG